MPIIKCDYLIGVDGGATKTDAVLADASGRVLARFIGPETNPSGQSRERARENLVSTLDALLSGFGGREAFAGGVFAGIAGTGLADRARELFNALSEILPRAAFVSNGSDAFNDMSAVLGDADGIVAIAGTGSCVYARRDMTATRVGGWGYLFDDVGSAYEIGRRALRECMRVADGLARPSALTSIVLDALGGPVGDKLSSIYEGGRTRIAAFAPLVTRALDEGCPVAADIVKDNALKLAELIRAARAYLAPGAARVVLTGAVFKAVGALADEVKRALGEGFEFYMSELPPVYGALTRAARGAGITPDASFKRAFSDTLRGFSHQC